MKVPVAPVEIQKVGEKTRNSADDLVVVEEPLEIRLKFSNGQDFIEKRLAVTMRTPGHDFELATGFLLTEGIIQSHAAIDKIFYCPEVKSPEEEGNVVIVVMQPSITIEEEIFNRNFYINSSCGVCGKSSIESIHTICDYHPVDNTAQISSDLIKKIPEISSQSQDIFKHTGGLHASVLLSGEGEVIMAREDVGRHNALDKLVGAAFAERLKLADKILFISGRAGFELIQKAVVAGIRTVVAVGAPSSLAVELARDYDLTLVGFASKGKFNIYSGAERVH